ALLLPQDWPPLEPKGRGGEVLRQRHRPGPGDDRARRLGPQRARQLPARPEGGATDIKWGSGMRRLRSGIAVAAVTVLALALGACGSQDDQGGGDAAATTATTAVKVAVERDFDPRRVSEPVTIDTQWVPR